MIARFEQFYYINKIKFILKFGCDLGNLLAIDNIKSDLYRELGSNDIDSSLKQIVQRPGLHFLFYLRLSRQEPKSRFKKFFHRIAQSAHRDLFYRFGFQIPTSTDIGRGFQLLHFGNVVLNPAVSIGMNCTIAQGVLVGQSKHGTPSIGNQVWIGANSVIVGNIKIGNNVLIAPGSYVNVDVPDFSLVIGNPCQIYSKGPRLLDDFIVNRV